MSETGLLCGAFRKIMGLIEMEEILMRREILIEVQDCGLS